MTLNVSSRFSDNMMCTLYGCYTSDFIDDYFFPNATCVAMKVEGQYL